MTLGKTIAYTFTQKLPALTAGSYSISATATFASDGVAANNTLTGNFKVNPAPTFTLTNPITSSDAQVSITGPAGMSKYLWSNTATTQNITVETGGTYSLTVTDANGCTSTQSTEVVFSTDIELTAIVNTSICQNNTPEPITVTVTNKSGRTITKGSELDFDGTINGVAFTEELMLAADLAPNASTTITLTASLPRATAGQYPITVEVDIDNDLNTDNNKKDATITVNPSPTFTLPADIVSSNTQETINGPSGMAAYLWSTGATTQSITVTKSGTYTLKVTNDKGCSSEQSILVQFRGGDLVLKSIVNNEKMCQSGRAVPLSLVIGNDGDMPILKGETITISVKSNGTVKTENFVLTEDLLPKTTATITLTTATGINAATAGSTVTAEVSVSYQYDVNTNNPSVTRTFTVVANPTFTIDIKTATDRSEATLTANKPELSYLWSTGATTKEITVYENSLYKVTGTNADGCTLTKEVAIDYLIPSVKNIVMVYPAVSQTKCYDGKKAPFEAKLVNESTNTPVATGTSIKISCTYRIDKPDGTALEYKLSGTTTLAQELKPGQSIVYRFDNMTAQGKQAANMVEEAAGKHTIAGFSEIGGKQGAVKTTQFEIYPIPKINLGNDVIYRPLPSTLNVNLTSDYTFLWSTGQNTSSIIIDTEGEYWVKVTSKNGCTASDTVEVKQGAEEATLKMNLYPNPAVSFVNIEAFASSKSDIFIEVYSSVGALIESKKFEATTQAIILNYDISRLESGSYVVVARTKDKKMAKMLQVAR